MSHVHDEDKRTTPMGFFNVAHSYYRSAEGLSALKLNVTHPDAPVSFLYFHAIELYLKSLLLASGFTVSDLRKPQFGHRISVLAERAAELGVVFDEADNAVFSFMAVTDIVIEARYIVTGYRTEPTQDALNQTCKRLHQRIGSALRIRGVMVRL